MGWSIGYDSIWDRDIGYGVPAYCDFPRLRRRDRPRTGLRVRTRLVLPVPPSAGLYWRLARGRIVKTAAARAYQQGVKMRALAQGCRPVTGPVAVTVQWFRAARRGDLDNHLKVVLDALQGAVYRNDNQIVELHAYRLEDRQNPRLWIAVEELAP